MNSFVKRLVKEGKIKLTEPSEDVMEAYLIKSDRSLLSSKTLLGIGNYEDAIALSYYSMYYSVLALFFKCGIKSENHTGAIILLKELFDIDTDLLENAKKERVDKQYYVDFKTTEKELKEAIDTAEEFIGRLKDFIEKLKINDVKSYMESFKSIYLSKT